MRKGSQLVVDLNILGENHAKIKSVAPNAETIFMVKADAYGHGLVPISRFSHRELGINHFGCASIGEAMSLRSQLKHDEFEIYVFSDTLLDLNECSQYYVNNRVIPVVKTFDDLKSFLENKDYKHFPLSLKFNTGMNRLGIEFEQREQAIDLIKQAGRSEIHHLMTHLSCASQSMKKNKKNIRALEEFEQLKKDFRDAGLSINHTSIANSGAIEQKVGLEETHIRPGLMMYGPSSLNRGLEDLSFYDGKMISSLETYVMHTFEVDRGQPIGYGASPVPTEGIVAIIALGYGDGLSTRMRGAKLNFGDVSGVASGRINMDMTAVLFPLGTKIKVGDKFTVWDEDTKFFSSLCEHAQTIPYEIFCQITPRVPRIYSLK
tara:strand:- start:53646 stop:54773 length:1128 start_codon:yes stop_codon:yes gene_type:complete